MPLARIEIPGDSFFLLKSRGWFCRVAWAFAGTPGDPGFDDRNDLLTLRGVASGLVLAQKLAGFFLLEPTADFHFLHKGMVGDLPVGELVAQLLIGG